MQWENAKDRSPGTVLADGKGRWTPRLVLYSPAVSSSYCGGISGLHQNCAGITDCVGLLTWEMKRVVSDRIASSSCVPLLYFFSLGCGRVTGLRYDRVVCVMSLLW